MIVCPILKQHKSFFSFINLLLLLCVLIYTNMWAQLRIDMLLTVIYNDPINLPNPYHFDFFCCFIHLSFFSTPFYFFVLNY